MTMTTEIPRPRYLTRHVTYRLPILGRIAREVVEGPEENAFYAIGMGVSLWLSAILLFGYPGLIIPALIAAAAMLVTLIRITLG